jgi:ABC-type transport system involved in cytochrome bd biosynthesis fused ATPase/permease subunit
MPADVHQVKNFVAGHTGLWFMSQVQVQQNSLAMTKSSLPIIGFVAYSGTGKTTLIEQLITFLTERSYKVSVIKHTHHHFDIDTCLHDGTKLL